MEVASPRSRQSPCSGSRLSQDGGWFFTYHSDHPPIFEMQPVARPSPASVRVRPPAYPRAPGGSASRGRSGRYFEVGGAVSLDSLRNLSCEICLSRPPHRQTDNKKRSSRRASAPLRLGVGGRQTGSLMSLTCAAHGCPQAAGLHWRSRIECRVQYQQQCDCKQSMHAS